MKFHEILRQRRLALRLTQEQLAQRLGVSAPAVNKWERNNSYPDITLLPPLARLPQEDRERPMLEAMLRRKQKRSEEAWPILERELFRQASDLQSTLMALMDLALEAGDKTCARQYSETAEQAGRVFQLTAYAVASAPLQLALVEQDGPEALAVLERLLRSLEEPWDLSASPLYRHLPTKEAAREVQQIMLQYLLEELERDPESAFLRETPGYQEMLERVHRAEI